MTKEVLGACIGFIFGIAGVSVAAFLGKWGVEYIPALLMMVILVNISIIFYGEKVINTIQAQRYHSRKITVILLSLVVLAFAIPISLHASDTVSRKTLSVRLINDFLSTVSNKGDVSTFIEPTIYGELPIAMLYNTPIQWDKEYFAKGWYGNKQFKVVCKKAIYQRDDIQRSPSEAGTNTYLYSPENYCLVWLTIPLSEGKWEQTFQFVLVKYDDNKWVITSKAALYQFFQALATDIEYNRLIHSYNRFKTALEKDNSRELLNKINPSLYHQFTDYQRFNLKASISDFIRSRLNYCSLPSYDEILPSFWWTTNNHVWISMTPKGGYCLRTLDCGQEGGLLWFDKNPTKTDWQIYIPQGGQ